MLLHASTVSVADALSQEASVSGSMGGAQGRAGILPGPGVPPTFKTTPKAPTQDPGLPFMQHQSNKTRLAPIHHSDPRSSSASPTGNYPTHPQQATSPPHPDVLGLAYQASHHAFVPHTRTRSALQRTHRAQTHTQAGAGTAAAAKTVLHRAATVGYSDGDDPTDQGLGAGVDWGFGAGRPGTWGGASSVGDLEALDAILDQLVVLDVRMRQALLKGPMVSFETVVSEAAAARTVTDIPGTTNYTDRTFHLTAVKGMVVEEETDAEISAQQQDHAHHADATATTTTTTVHATHADIPPQHVSGGTLAQRQTHARLLQEEALESVQQAAGGIDPDAATFGGAIPVPILPKLARMYITSKATAAVKAPPPAPPTAAWLLKARLPVPGVSAPTYDKLISQIKDVQRQYTCGTAKDKTVLASEAARMPAAPPKTNLDNYISGIDGPPLADVVAPQLSPGPTERSRPSFVSMMRVAHSARLSPARERVSLSLPLGTFSGASSPTRGPSPLRGAVATSHSSTEAHAATATAVPAPTSMLPSVGAASD